MKVKNLRQMPLRSFQALNRFISVDKGIFQQEETEDAYCLIKDPSPGSDFYFKIIDVVVKDGQKVVFNGVAFPRNISDSSPNGFNIFDNQIESEFKEWVDKVSAYNNLIQTYKENVGTKEEKIIDGYTQEFFEDFEKFELVDEDADTHSYPLEVQKTIDMYCQKLILRLETYKEDNDLDKVKEQELNNIIKGVKDLQENQTRLTKKQVLDKLSTLWAQMRKAGLKVLSEAKTEAVKEMIKQGVKGLLENSGGVIDAVANIFT